MSTGNINITVLGGYLDGAVHTLPVTTRGIKLSHTGQEQDAILYVCVRGADNRAYALHPITGYAKLEAINEAWRRATTATLGPATEDEIDERDIFE